MPVYRELDSSRNMIRAKYMRGVNSFDTDLSQITMAMVDQGDAVACRGLAVVS